MRQQILIVGAGAQTAAMSAVRAGLAPLAADAFADQDLREIARTVHVAPYPLALQAAIAEMPRCPWLYTGGLENRPGLIDRIGRDRPLRGNGADTLRAVRDPLRVAHCLGRHGLDSPTSVREPPCSPSGRWLVKPLSSCGGRGIQFWDASGSCVRLQTEKHYFQKYLDGPAYGAVYVADGQRALLVGITRQWAGLDWTGAKAFAYCGSIGPAALESAVVDTFRRIGSCLAADFGLVGLFGVDAIVQSGRVYVLEVNPRYTASVELLEHALDRALLADHVQACSASRLPGDTTFPCLRLCGKAVLYARTDVRIRSGFQQMVEQINTGDSWRQVVDVPCADTWIPAGGPIATLRCTGNSADKIENHLRHLAERIELHVYQ